MQESILMYCVNHVRQHDLSPQIAKAGFAMKGPCVLRSTVEERLVTVHGPLGDARSQSLGLSTFVRILEAWVEERPFSPYHP